MAYEMAEPGGKPVSVLVTYSPDSGKLAVSIDGREMLVHVIGTLVTAPAQVTTGENRIDLNVTAGRFTGRVREVRKRVG